jgi:hypothetical protein
VHLLINGTTHEKKESCCHSSSLTSQILHENKGHIVQAGAIKTLVELVVPESAEGMVDKAAVVLLVNLAMILV